MEGKKNYIYFECIQDVLEANLKLFKIALSKLISILSYVSFDTFEQVFEYLDSLNLMMIKKRITKLTIMS